MLGFSSSIPLKFFVLAVIALAVLLVTVNGVYTGPRYGKRESSEVAGRVLQKSNGIRNIQSRSGSGQRFYPGTRFGGKRAYWQPTQFASDIENSDIPSSNLPYDCFHTRFYGIRCVRPDEVFGSMNEEQDQPSAVDHDGVQMGISDIAPEA